jgi:hypothetical protein
MITQISDYLTYNQKQYRIVGVQGQRLLHLCDFGVVPTGTDSNCWRGFHMGYTLIDDKLVATRLTVIGQVMTVIDGILPAPGRVYERAGRTCWGDTEWMGLERKAPFTGKILIGKDFIYDMIIQMGFQKPTAFQNVIELVFEDGRLLETFDISDQIALLREKILEVTQQQKAIEEKERDIEAWVEHKFSLNYDAWWWN